MQLLPVIETADFYYDMDQAIVDCGAKVFPDCENQDYLEFPLNMSAEETLNFSPIELTAYFMLRSHINVILGTKYRDTFDTVLLQNYI